MKKSRQTPHLGQKSLRFLSKATSPLACASALALALLATQNLHAQFFYWDGNGTTSGFGAASGTWADPATNNSALGAGILVANGNGQIDNTSGTWLNFIYQYKQQTG